MAMNPGPDMEHDTQLAEIYRAAAQAGPPARLDEAILAAARREVKAGPRRGGLRRWQLPLSLAAVLVLSVTLVSQMREQGADRPEALLSPPAGVQPRAVLPAEVAPASPPPAAVRETGVSRQGGEGQRGDSQGQEGLAAAPDRPPVAAIPQRAEMPQPLVPGQKTLGAASVESRAAPAAADAGPAPAEDGASARPERQAPRPLLRSAPAPSTDMAPGTSATAPPRPAALVAPDPAALWRDLALAPAEQWIERIVELRRAGKTADADALAAEFGRRFPDRHLPAETR